jgi:hypothetical protein
MKVRVYVFMLTLTLSLFINSVCQCIYTCMYIYIHTERERERVHINTNSIPTYSTNVPIPFSYAYIRLHTRSCAAQMAPWWIFLTQIYVFIQVGTCTSSYAVQKWYGAIDCDSQISVFAHACTNMHAYINIHAYIHTYILVYIWMYVYTWALRWDGAIIIGDPSPPIYTCIYTHVRAVTLHGWCHGAILWDKQNGTVTSSTCGVTLTAGASLLSFPLSCICYHELQCTLSIRLPRSIFDLYSIYCPLRSIFDYRY